MPELVNATQRSAFAAGARSLIHLNSVVVLGIGALFSYLTDRSQVSLQDSAFIASVTVMVFLLPAAGIVGPYLLAETKDALAIIWAHSDETERNEAQSSVGGSVSEILKAAKPLQRGFSYTTLAVVLSSVSLAETKLTIDGVDVDRVIAALAIALLLGTAMTVFPMTWRLLQLEQVQGVYDSVLAPGRGPAGPSGPAAAGPVGSGPTGEPTRSVEQEGLSGPTAATTGEAGGGA